MTLIDSIPEPTVDRNAVKVGIPGFVYADLFNPGRLRALFQAFVNDLERRDPSVGLRYREILEKGTPTRDEESWIAVEVGPHVSAFVASIFQIEGARKVLADATKDLGLLMRVRKEFTKQRVLKKAWPGLDRADAAVVTTDAMALVGAFGQAQSGEHPEFAFARAVAALLDLEMSLRARRDAKPGAGAAPSAGAREIAVERVLAAVDPAFRVAHEVDARIAAVSVALDRLARFGAFHRVHDPHGRIARGWVIFRTQEPMSFDHLVRVERRRPDFPELMVGPDEHLRRRIGFDLTDPRMEPREIVGEIETCIFCHERDRDTCAKGIFEKDGAVRKNPVGIALEGCPLDEHISEAHLLRSRGDALAALAAIMINNPMTAGTGHRICNDCMKSCIYQKQEPVNIPQIETSILTDVLAMPYGVEIYGLLSRWNPLNVRRPFQLPLNGKKILIVGLGPAGYTLAHYLSNEGFGVVCIDGLKIEPLPRSIAGGGFKPVEKWDDLREPLSERIGRGFGGVSEYGITVRWDKNFLLLIYLTLARKQGLRIFGGIRFGGTLTLEDAAELGFDHVAIATGAGKPTVVDLKNNLIRGIRKASDFLMALQLTGAARESSLANLQVELPAVVIGGGLTAIDTATELFHYYPVMVERVADRIERLRAAGRLEAFEKRLNPEEQAILARYREHAAAFRRERQRAAAAGEKPDFIPIVRGFGGVTIAYRKSMQDSPAYRLNHEEIIKALEEGIAFSEHLAPVEALPDERGVLRAVRFERQAVKDGKQVGTGEFIDLPARSLMVAAGTSPNTIYEREYPGTFKKQPKGGFFQPYQASVEGGQVTLKEGAARDSFFTSYSRSGLTVSFYGDNHPAYAGNVVKAMASAFKGYGKIVELFGSRIRNLDPAGQPVRDRNFRELAARLDDELRCRVVRVERLTPTITEVVLRAPYQSRKFKPGQFYRLQDFETQAPTVDGINLAMEGLALTGAWVDPKQGLLSLIILEMGGSSNLCATLKPGQEVICMGPTGAPTEIPRGEDVLLAGGGLGNAVLFSIARALRDAGCRVLYFAGYKDGADVFKQDEIEAATDQVIFSTDAGAEIVPRRPQDRHFRGNIVQAMVSYGQGRFGEPLIPLRGIRRIIAIGSDRMMAAVKDARHDPKTLQPLLAPDHVAVGSINSPMQCMMKEVCAQCLQRHVDPISGKETFVFSCFNQDQELDRVDFGYLNSRLKQNGLLEKLAAGTIAMLAEKAGLAKV